ALSGTPGSKAQLLAAGMNRLIGTGEITSAPEPLLGKPALLLPRGDGSKAAPSWTLQLGARARIYLCVVQRGGYTVAGNGWTKTALRLTWKVPAGVEFTDDIYTKVVEAGAVEIPGHEGKEGANFGVPHLVVLDDPASTVAAGTEPPKNRKLKSDIRLWIEAENFAMKSDWAVENDMETKFLVGKMSEQPDQKSSPALTMIQVPESGLYTLWVRAKDYPKNQPGSRRFAVEVNGERSKIEFGTHGQEGWGWQNGGTFDIPAGEAVLGLVDTAAFFGRCDKILLASDPKFEPEGSGPKENVAHRKLEFRPLRKSADGDFFLSGPAGKEVAKLSGGELQLVFESFTANGETAIAPRIATLDGSTISPARNQYCVWIESEENLSYYNPRTSHSPNFKVSGEMILGEKKFSGVLNSLDPFLAAQIKRYFYGASLASADSKRVVLKKDSPEFSAEIVWSFSGTTPVIEVTVTPKKNTFATLGIYAFPEVTKDDTSFFLLPYHYQARRFPEEILMMPAATATAPLALVETKKGGKIWSFAVAADLHDEPMAWLSFENSRFALAVQNERGMLQPGYFSPVPATSRYAVKAGTPFRARAALFAKSKSWNETFNDVVFDWFGIRDIRRNWGGTLHDAALNMFDLLMNDQAVGWLPKHMGFVQIENKNTVSQSSLLMSLEQYWLTGDETVWDRRALPNAAFLFSRGTQHFATHPTDYGKTYVQKIDFQGPVKLYGTSTYQGMNEQFRGRAPVFFHDALNPNGKAKLNNGYNTIPPFSETYYAWKLTGDRKYLETAIAEAKDYIASNLDKVWEKPRGFQAFIKLDIPPYFWAFVDLYEETKDPVFLNAAKLGADYLLTTLYIHPYPFQETYSVTRQEALDNSRPSGWWWLDRFYRLGFKTGDMQGGDHPPTLNPIRKYLEDPSKIREEVVPAWVVSPLGLSIEQPFTIARGFTLTNKTLVESPLFPIRQNCETAYLMRLWGLTKEKRYWTYARNGILGQFNNYPGYYINLLSTTERSVRYPLEGPDLSDIYFHHIPVHLAFTVDFLFTAAETRSGGRIKFPSVLQQGYVWFINRMVGHRPGVFYGVENAQPLLKRGLFQLSTIALNAVSAASPDTFCVFLMNEEETNVRATLTLQDAQLQFADPNGPVTLIADNGPERKVAMSKGTVQVELSPKG
ncbi:MAG: hypothetical protein JNM63_09555, partial [Spirochaetia bacterium]|nr:hypothetical protein [Spirochaetia bacterium]